MSSADSLDIRLQGRAYTVACKPQEREELIQAVSHLDAQMSRIAQQTHTSGERLAVMAALNLAHELIQARKPPPSAAEDETARRIRAIEARLAAAMADEPRLL